MGNDHSKFPDLEIEEKAIEVSDFWSQHAATITNSEYTTNLSVLIGEVFLTGPLWSSQTPLEKNSKNLMIYRHPCIVKYVSSWKKNSKYYLATEEIKPLSHVLPSLDSLQICIGLHSILTALCFLHEKAQVSHNNICLTSVYVTKDGSWKLGGMEYLRRYSDLSNDYLSKSKSSRYNKAIDPNEEKNIVSSARKDIVDVFAFGVLVCEVLKSKNDGTIPSLTSFYELCKNDLQNVSFTKRPKLVTLLNHKFFNHEFLLLHSFLNELPLKPDEEKVKFFTNIVEKLKSFDEVVVASQLGGLLLSRMVLLHAVAQDKLLPLLLCPRTDQSDVDGLFSEEIFKKFIVPKLLEMFSVRDAQIRLLLLMHFDHYVHAFSKEELQSCILPELLVGIKDTNDHLVSVTLRTLADLVPILGASTVIGGKRAKLFNDGRPISHQRSRKNSKKPEPSLRTNEIPIATLETSQNTSTPDLSNGGPIDLPAERPRPDGEEVEISTEELEQSLDENVENWEDWDLNEHTETNEQAEVGENESGLEENQSQAATVQIGDAQRKASIVDIAELDIKNRVNSSISDDEFNFFQDMEPVIETSTKFIIDKDESVNLIVDKLNLKVNEGEMNEDGWNEEEW